MTKEEIKTYKEFKDEEDEDDFGMQLYFYISPYNTLKHIDEDNFKKIEKKFLYCQKDIAKKKSLKTEMNLISYETIVRHHPALKFLDVDMVVDILKNRGIGKVH